MDETRLQAAVDAAELACRGLTDKHVAGIDAADVRTLIEAAAGPLSQLTAALQHKTGRQRVWANVGVLRHALQLATPPAAGNAAA